jgi:hypothetical protein
MTLLKNTEILEEKNDLEKVTSDKENLPFGILELK